MSFAEEAADLGRRADVEITQYKSQAEQAVETIAALRSHVAALEARIAELETSTPPDDPHNPDPEEPDPDPEHEPVLGYGSVGNRPPVTVRPNADTTGPRTPTKARMTGPEALRAVLATAPEFDGFRVLRNVHVTSMIQMNSSAHHSIAFEDCIIDAGTTTTGGENLAAIRGWHALRDPAPATERWPEFRNCEIRDGHNAGVLGGYVRLLRCDIHGGYDGIQQHRPLEAYACYVHDLYYAPNDHSDAIQILGGVGARYEGCNVAGFSGDTSPLPHGQLVNRCVQIGAGMMSSASAEFHGNWFDGGNYTIDSSDPMSGTYPVTLTWRGNRLGRRNKWGPIYRVPSARSSFDRSNVWDDNGQPVLP